MADKLFSRRAGVLEGLCTLLVLLAAMVAFSAPPAAFAADEDQYLNAGRGIGSRLMSLQMVPITMAAGATTQATITLPAGSYIRAIKAETAVAFTGTPTNINLTAGSTAGGTDIMAATDVHTVGHVTGTIVAGFDVTNATAAAAYTINFQIVNVGGTNPAGTVYVYVDYAAPVR